MKLFFSFISLFLLAITPPSFAADQDREDSSLVARSTQYSSKRNALIEAQKMKREARWTRARANVAKKRAEEKLDIVKKLESKAAFQKEYAESVERELTKEQLKLTSRLDEEVKNAEIDARIARENEIAGVKQAKREAEERIKELRAAARDAQELLVEAQRRRKILLEEQEIDHEETQRKYNELMEEAEKAAFLAREVAIEATEKVETLEERAEKEEEAAKLAMERANSPK